MFLIPSVSTLSYSNGIVSLLEGILEVISIPTLQYLLTILEVLEDIVKL